MKKKKSILKPTFLFFMLMSLSGFAQDKNISGTVQADGAPLPGVSIVVQGTTRGTTTDFDGLYTISVSEGDVLLFSYIGFVAQQVTVGSQSAINVTLLEDASKLDEVVVVGYGVKRRADLTGSVSSLDAKTFEVQPVTTLEEGIQGRLSGVQVVQSSGQPGAGTSIRIRGVASLAGSSEPLFVIDGIPQFNSDVRDANGLSNIDPNEIASIEVLKDAASTAIYGSRAANGVVLITTKRGKAGEAVFRFSNNIGVQTVRNQLDLMSGQEYVDFVTEYYNNSIADGDLTEADRDQALGEIQDLGVANTDWQDELFRSAIRQNYSLSVSGGSEDSRYFVSLNYLDQEGAVLSTDFNRLALRINLDNNIGKRVKLSTQLAGSRTFQNRFLSDDGTNDTTGGKNGIGAVISVEPSISPRDANGNLSDARAYSFSGVNNENPFAFAEATDERDSYRFQGNVEARIDLIEGLTNTVRLGATYNNTNTGIYLPSSLLITPQQARIQEREDVNLLLENFVTYTKQFGQDFNLNLVGGIAFQRETSNRFSISGQGLPDDNLTINALQALESVSPPQTNNIEQALNSVFGRANLSYKGRYLFNASVRRDGASQFAEGNKFATFPAASVGWKVSEEDFIPDGSFISNLKLRASWGQSGNQAIQPYQSLTIGSSVNTPQGNGTGLNSALAPNLPNENLTWETATQTNLGLDLGFDNQKYRFSLDIYSKTTEDLLANVLLPLSSGFSSIISNVGEIRNDGFEISAGVDIPFSEDFEILLDGNLSANDNEVVRTNNGEDIITGGSNDTSRATLIVREGESISSFFMTRFLGLDENGLPQFEDLDGNGIIDQADRQIVGSSLPDFVYGLNVTTNYKRFSLAMNWQGAAGLTVFNSRLSTLVSSSPGVNKRRDLRDFTPRPSVQAQSANRSSDRFLEDASYFRLKNVKLNYSVPTANINGVSNLNVFISAQNLLTFTGYSGFDPEVNSFSGGDLRQGVDLSAYPSVRSITLGLNMSF